jgi:iron complex outermembrane receptor protein
MYQLYHPAPCALRKLTVAVALALPALTAPITALAADSDAQNIANTPNKIQSFNIAAQPLADALNAFIAASDWQVGFPAGVGKDVRSNAVIGSFTPQQALQKLLTGTGLSYRLTGNNAVTLEKTTVSEPQSNLTMPAVTVTGQRAYGAVHPYNSDYSVSNASAATKTDTPVMETPFSVQVVPKQVMEDQQVVRLDKALNNVAGVQYRPGNAGTQDMSYIRGFANTGYYRDGFLLPTGIGGGGVTKRDPANLERVEVLKGPGSMLFGRAEPGGIVNMVTKPALATPYYSLQQQFGSYDFYRTTLDATGPVNQDQTLLYRLNMAYENSGSYLNNVDGERVFVAPVLSWQISPQTTASLALEYLHFDDPIDHGIPVLNGTKRPAPVPRSFTLNEPLFNKNTGDRTGIFMNWSHAFNDNWTLSHRFGVELIDWNTLGVSFGAAQANGNLVRNFYALRDQSSQRFLNTLNLTGHFATGVANHTLLLGYENFQFNQDRQLGSQSAPAAFNVFNPTYMSAGPTLFPNSYTPFELNQDWDGFYAQDQIELPYNVFAMAGVRYDQSKTQFDRNHAPISLSEDDMVTPRGGLLWRPIHWLSLYGSYSENFGPSNYLSNTPNTSLKPQIAQQWEVGAKTEFWDGRFTATVSYFDLSKQNIPVPIPGTIYSTTIGAGESRGIEFESTGELLAGFKLIAAYAYMPFAKVTNDPVNLGKRLPMAPEHSGSVWATYEFQGNDLNGLKFGGGVVAASQREGNDGNTYELPGYATVNLMSSYAVKIGPTKVTTQVNVDNLLDKTYFVGSNGLSSSWYGAPRSVLGSIRVEY